MPTYPDVSQTPRIHYSPKGNLTFDDAEDAIELASSYGLDPDEWQRRVIHSWFAKSPDGQWASRRAGIAVPRQCGKGALIEIRELYGAAVLGERILHTSHHMGTSLAAFNRISGFFENPEQYPELAELVARINRTNGREEVLFHNGGSIRFAARTKGSGRGLTVDVLILDEAQELSSDALAALLPTTAAGPQNNPQVIMLGTPPAPNMEGDAFKRIREDGVAGQDDSLSWHEWSCEPGDDPDDPEVWAACIPALGSRIRWETVEAERAAMDEETFMRERLGLWNSATGTAVISQEQWQSIADPESQPGSGLVLAVDMNPARTTASLVIASVRDDEKTHVEFVDQRQGTGWVLGRITQICEQHGIKSVVIDSVGPAASLIEQIEKKRIKVTATNARDMANACAQFYDAVQDGQLTHINQPPLNVAVASAKKRKLGDAWAWNRTTAASDITPLVAATLAHWGANSSKVKKSKKGKQPSSSKKRTVILR